MGAVTFKKVVCNPTIRVSAMHLVATFLVLCASSAESWAQTCDRFHNRGVLFLGGTGKLVIHLGATKQELDQGDISMKISNCDGTCIIKSLLFQRGPVNVNLLVVLSMDVQNRPFPRQPWLPRRMRRLPRQKHRLPQRKHRLPRRKQLQNHAYQPRRDPT